MAAIDSLLHRLTAGMKLLSVAAVALAAGRALAADDQPAARPDDVPPALTVVGRVQDALLGKPIEGAKVTITRFADGDTRHVLNRIETTTDADGKYKFALATDHPFTPQPTIRGYTNGSPIFGPAAPPGFPISIEVRHPEYAGETSRVTIPLDLAGTSAFGNRSDEPAVMTARWLRPDEHPNERRGGNFELIPGKEVFGILQTPDGHPAQGVEVFASSTMPRNETHVTRPSGNNEPYFETSARDTVVTDAEGHFRVGLVTPGSATLTIYPERDFAPVIKKLYDRRGDLGVIKLQRGLVIKGRVVDVQGKPLGEVQVVAVPWEAAEANIAYGEPTLRRQAISDAHGNFALGTLPPGEFRLEPQAHYESAYVDENGQVHSGSHPLPGIFIPQKLTLAEGRDPAAIEVRELPTVSIEGRAVVMNDANARGVASAARIINPGTSPAVVQGLMDGQIYRVPIVLTGSFPPNPNTGNVGSFSIKLPRGLSETVLEIDTQRVVAGDPSRTKVQWRLGKESPLQSTTKIGLGILDHDVQDLEIVYTPVEPARGRGAAAAAAGGGFQGAGRGGRGGAVGRGGAAQRAQQPSEEDKDDAGK